MSIEHCACNYIPSVCNWFEMEDLTCLIAPRKLIVVTGENDKIFPISGVRSSFEVAKKIFIKAGAKDNCRLIETSKAHDWVEKVIWDVAKREINS